MTNRWKDELRQDVRFGIRILRKSPTFALMATLSVALGVAANVIVFGLLYAALLRPLPFKDSGRVVAVQSKGPEDTPGEGMLFSFPDYQDLRQSNRANRAFEETGAYLLGYGLTLSGSEGPERVEAGLVSAELFPLLGVDPILGRHFHKDEDRWEEPPTLLLSHELWQTRFGGDPQIVGRQVLANSIPHTVVGVMPPGFRLPYNRYMAWVPLRTRMEPTAQRALRNLTVLARLRPGVTLEEAQKEVSSLAGDLARKYPDSNAGWSATVVPARKAMLVPQLQVILLSLMGVVSFVLLIACANVAHLVLELVIERKREISIRAAFGAGRRRLVRQLLTESILIALAGGLLGTLAAAWGLRGVARLLPEGIAPYWLCIRLDTPVLACAAGATAAAWLLFGMAPALQASRPDLHTALKDGGRSAGSTRARRARASLIVAEVAVSTVLLVGSALLLRSFLALRAADLGIQTKGLVSLWIYLPGDTYKDQAVLKAERVAEVVSRLRDIPGVDSAAASNNVPVYGGSSTKLDEVESEGWPAGKPRDAATSIFVTSGFFQAAGARLLQGRDLTPEEAVDVSGVAVVNETFARRFWPDRDAVGRRFQFHGGSTSDWLTVVGVVRDLRDQSDLRNAIMPCAYVPFAYNRGRPAAILLRTQRDLKVLLPKVREAVRAVDPSFPVFRVATMEENLSEALHLDRLFSSGFALFGALGLLLAAVGVYGVLSYAVSRRLREIGIRLALGARRWDVLRLVVGHGILLTIAGIVLGLAGAAAVSGNITEALTLYQVTSTDPVSFAGVSILLIEVAFFASYLPARRATEVDPITVLRGE